MVANANPIGGTAEHVGRQGILVLGMHRSGTSALARLLNLAGCELGQRLISESEGNRTGHWENAFAVETDERLLAALGRRWDDLRALPTDWRGHPAARSALTAIRSYAQAEFAGPLFALKDPRMCRLAPLWIEALDPSHCRLSAVIVLRHPLEIAASLAARDGFSLARSLLLWLRHLIECEAATRDLPRCFVRYDEVLADGLGTLRRIASELALDGLRQDDDLRTDIERFLDHGMRHHRQERADPLRDLAPTLAQMHDALLALADGGDARAALESVAGSWHAWSALYDGLLDEQASFIDALWQRAGHAEAALAGAARDIGSIPEQLERLGQALADGQRDLLTAVSVNIQRMQAEHAGALTEAARAQAQAGLAMALAPKLDALDARVADGQDRLLAAYVEDIRQMQAAQEQALTESARLQGEAALGRVLSPQLQTLQERLEITEQQVLRAISEDIRQMQAEHARALATAERQGGELAEARTHAAQREAQWLAASTELAEAHRQLVARQVAQAEREQRIAALQSSIDELTRTLTMQVRLRERAETAVQRLLTSRWWRFSRPARACVWQLRRLRRRLQGLPGIGPFQDDRELQAIARGETIGCVPVVSVNVAIDREAPLTAPARPPLAEQPMSLPDVYVWAVIDWHFRYQRPQHIASALARKGHRVFYLSNHFIDDRRPGVRVEALDDSGRLFQVHLHLPGAPAIYHQPPDAEALAALASSLAELLAWTDSRRCISLVQHPYWRIGSRMLPNVVQVYDCMDHHAGFDNTGSAVIEAEHALIADADLVIVSSQWLADALAPQSRNLRLVRNAADYAFFSRPPERVRGDALGRPIVGYFGAIAEWFDCALIRALAEALPQVLIRLVGSDTASAARQLADLANVEFIGEVPYADLPQWLHGFDVCLLPFRVTPLTEATNPVKVYEYLSAGKPVVAIDLPEMAQFGDTVRVASTPQAFVAAVAQLLDDPGGSTAVAERQKFASEQTWDHRARAFDEALENIAEPCVSVVVLTYNNLVFTQACLFSIEHYSDYRNLEVIVVDNASSDGSRQYLQDWLVEPSAAGHRRRLILNEDNLGFAAGNNVGLAVAEGEFLILLNNDTFVTPGWVRGLTALLRREARLGLVGPVTNNIGNEARIDIVYPDMAAMLPAARRYTLAHPGQWLPLHTAAFFCVAMPRVVYQTVGGLDEAFGIGFFEDDDYCRRVEQAGWRIGCAEDVFVHHHLSATFEQKQPEERKALFERNKAIYEAKWGPWQPHAYRSR